MIIIWGISYSLFRLCYQLKIFSYDSSNFGINIGFCLSVQRLGSFIAVTFGVYLATVFGLFNILFLLSIFLIPAFIIITKIKEIDLARVSDNKLRWNLLFFDYSDLLRRNILLLSFFLYPSILNNIMSKISIF